VYNARVPVLYVRNMYKCRIFVTLHMCHLSQHKKIVTPPRSLHARSVLAPTIVSLSLDSTGRLYHRLRDRHRRRRRRRCAEQTSRKMTRMVLAKCATHILLLLQFIQNAKINHHDNVNVNVDATA
jgi:hypothetical protein